VRWRSLFRAEAAFRDTGMDKGYMPQLDGLRAFAVASVLVFHWFKPSFGLGEWGVTLFFVLSGYLITRNIAALKTAGLPVATAARVFFVRRTLRLFPAYYLTLLLGAFLFEDVRREWAWYVAYASNLLLELRQRPVAMTPTWSLAVEEQFYIVWFLLVMTVPARRLPWLMALLIVMAPMSRWTSLPGSHPMLGTWTLWAHCDALLLGALLARLEDAGKGLPLSAATVIAMALAVGVLTATVSPQSSLYSAVAPLLIAAIATWIVWHARTGFSGAAGTMLSDERVVYIGKISYGVYLYHMVTPAIVETLGITKWPVIWRLFEASSLHGFIVHCTITVALASFSFRYFEMPIRKLAGPRKVSAETVGQSAMK
jgi:peptidoglycan/LPS O-acetylase OafA/YrhL